MSNLISRARSNAVVERVIRRVYERARNTPVGRPVVARLRARSLADLSEDSRRDADRWRTQKIDVQTSSPLSLFDVVADASRHVISEDKTIDLLALPLVLQARTVVELGCAGSFYNDGMSYREALRLTDEGQMSTRVLATACRLLRATGTPATLHSVDIREWPEQQRSLMEDLGMGDLWRLHQGTNSVEWLRQFEGEIDVLLVDSNHTYEHVRDELAAGLPKMAPRSAILVDNCYTTIYRTGVSYMDDESALGIARGGEFGAILEFLDANPEWTAYWKHGDVVTLTRGWDLPTTTVSRA